MRKLSIENKKSKAEGEVQRSLREVNWDEENLRVDIAPSACLILLLGGNSDPPIALVDALALLRELQCLVPAQLDVVVRHLPDDWRRRSFWHWNCGKPKLSIELGIIAGSFRISLFNEWVGADDLVKHFGCFMIIRRLISWFVYYCVILHANIWTSNVAASYLLFALVDNKCATFLYNRIG